MPPKTWKIYKNSKWKWHWKPSFKWLWNYFPTKFSVFLGKFGFDFWKLTETKFPWIRRLWNPDKHPSFIKGPLVTRTYGAGQTPSSAWGSSGGYDRVSANRELTIQWKSQQGASIPVLPAAGVSVMHSVSTKH